MEIFDLMGYHSTTGEELLPITKEIASGWNEQQRKVPPRAPKSVQLRDGTVFFDPITGAPLLWFSQKAKGEYEFFDGPGFNPRNGDPLKPFTKDQLNTYEQKVQAKLKELKDEQDRLQRQKEERDAEDARKKQALEEKQREERKKRDEEWKRITEAARKCDELAANPNDLHKTGVGAEFSALKAQAPEAIKACEIAVQQNPRELRYKYQLGRALEWADRRRALGIYEELAGLGYAAAYDNLGRLYYEDLRNPGRAVSTFRKGLQAGDPDSMVSLAEMIDRRYTVSTSPAETKIQLYRRAAQLGTLAQPRRIRRNWRGNTNGSSSCSSSKGRCKLLVGF